MFTTYVINEFLVEAGLCAALDNAVTNVTNKDTVLSLTNDDTVRVLALTSKWIHDAKKSIVMALIRESMLQQK